MFFSKLSLRSKLFGIIFGGLLIVSVSAASVFSVIIGDLEKKTSESLLPMAQNLSAAIAAQFYERYADVQAFATNRGLTKRNKAEFVDILNDYTLLYQIYDTIIMVDMDGNYLASNSLAPDKSKLDLNRIKNTNFNGQEWFQKAKNRDFSENHEKGFLGTVVSDVEIDPVSSALYNKNIYGNSFTSVVKDSKGKPFAVLSARAGFRWVEYEFKKMYEALDALGYGHAELTLLDKKGTIIVDYDPHVTGTKEVKRNLDNVLLKLNLAEKGVTAVEELVKGNSGSVTSFHARKKLLQISGYSKLDSEKFLTNHLGWGTLIRVPQDQVLSGIQKSRILFFTLIGAGLLLSIVVVGLYSKQLVNSLNSVATKLRSGSETVATASSQISSSSQDLSNATNNQASSLQETVASISEISAMVKKNAETASHSKELAEYTEEAALQGKKSLDELIHKINEIGESNERIQGQMEKSNDDIGNIVKVITAISEKTKVINDIVFQTKLLSFNASVEAQRAGDHGKGFSVVAEEVGKLAQMSGAASSEISVLIDDSMKEVESIVSQTNTSIGKLVEESKNIVSEGQKLAGSCSEVLDNVVVNVKDVNQKMAQISTASTEQDTGIREVTEAMNRLDGVTHKNSDVAHQTSESVQVLNHETIAVRQVVVELSELVNGKAAHQNNVEELDVDDQRDEFDLAS